MGVGITYGGETEVFYDDGNHEVGGHVFTITFGETDAVVGSVIDGTTISALAEHTYNSAEFYWAGG